MDYKIIEFDYNREESKLRKVEIKNCENLINVLSKLINRKNSHYYLQNEKELKEELSNYFEKDINEISNEEVLRYIEYEMVGDGESCIEILEDENGNIIYKSDEFENETYENYKGSWYKENYSEEGYEDLISELNEKIVLD